MFDKVSPLMCILFVIAALIITEISISKHLPLNKPHTIRSLNSAIKKGTGTSEWNIKYQREHRNAKHAPFEIQLAMKLCCLHFSYVTL